MGSKRKSNSNSWIPSPRKKLKTFYFSLENQMQLIQTKQAQSSALQQILLSHC